MAIGISFLPKLPDDFQSPLLSLYRRSTVALSMVTGFPFTVALFSQTAADTPWQALNFVIGFFILFTSGTTSLRGLFRNGREEAASHSPW